MVLRHVTGFKIMKGKTHSANERGMHLLLCFVQGPCHSACDSYLSYTICQSLPSFTLTILLKSLVVVVVVVCRTFQSSTRKPWPC